MSFKELHQGAILPLTPNYEAKQLSCFSPMSPFCIHISIHVFVGRCMFNAV